MSVTHLELPYSIDAKNPFLLDKRSGPWASKAAANAGIPEAVRVQGLVVIVQDAIVGYYYKDGIEDVDLVPINTDEYAIWGQISGNLTDQTDLQAALDAKEDDIAPGTTGQYWRGDKTWQTLDTSNVPENGAVYFTQARARQSIDVTATGNSGAATYNNTTGIINIPQYTLAGLGGEPAIALGTSLQYWRGDKSWQTLNTDAVPEATAKYYTDARVLAYGNTQWPRLDGSYTNPSWIVSLPWSKITNTPTTIAGYGITDAFTEAESDARYVKKAGDTMTGNLLFAAPAGIDSSIVPGEDILNLGTANASVINIGWSGATINIQGSVMWQDVDNLAVTDKLIRLNKGGATASGVSSGFEIEENAVITGWFATDSTRTGWDFKAPASQQLTLGLDLLTASRTIKMPNLTGTLLIDAATYNDPAWLATLAWSKITGTPTTLSGYGISNAYTKTEVDSLLTNYVPIGRQLTINGVAQDLSANRSWTVGDVRTDSSYSNPTWLTALAWSKITGTPTTLGGYGISDAYTTTQINAFFFGSTPITGYNKSNWDTAFGWGNWAAGSHYIGTTLIANNRGSGAQTLTGVSIDGNASTASYWGGFAANFNVAATTMDYFLVRESGAGIMKVGSAALVQSFLGLGSAAYINASTSVIGSTILQRDSSGDGFLRYLNTSQAAETGTITAVITRQGDNYMRVSSTAHFISNLGLATTSSLASYVPYSGATGHVNIGGWNLSAYSVIATNAFLSDNYYRSSGTPMMAGTSSYTMLYTQAGVVGMYLGGAVDPANYYDNTVHNFRNIGGGTTYAVIANGSTFYNTLQAYNIDTVNRTTYRDVLFVTANATTLPYTGHGGGIVFRGSTYQNNGSNITFARIGAVTNSDSVNSYGSTLFVDIATNSSGAIARGFEMYWTGNSRFFYDLTVDGSLNTDSIRMRTATSLSFVNQVGTVLGTFNHSSGVFAANYGLAVTGRSVFTYISPGPAYTLASAEIYSSGSYGPRLSLHWGGVVASQIGVESDGTVVILNNPGTSYEKFKAGAGVFTSSLTAFNITVTQGVTIGDGYGLNAGNFQVGAITSNRFYIYNNTLALDNISIAPSTGITTFARGIVGTSATFSSTITAGSAGANIRLTGDGGAGNDGFVGADGSGNLYFRNWTGNRGFYINSSNYLIHGGALNVGSAIYRANVLAGYLNGGYSSVETTTTPGLIYGLGDPYLPTSSALSAMYGVGYTHNSFAGNPRGASGWGFYIAGAGTMHTWIGEDAYRSSVPIVITSALASSFSGNITAASMTVSAGGTLEIVSGDIWIRNNGGFGILSSNANRAIAITNTAVGLNYTLNGTNFSFFTSGASDYVGRVVATNTGGTKLVFLAGVSGVSNGFTVTHDGTNMVYHMAHGGLTVDGTLTSTSYSVSGRGTGFIYGFPDWRIYNTTGNGLAFSNYSTDVLTLANSGVATFSNTAIAPNFADGFGSYNVNLGSGGLEGRGIVAGYSGGNYGGIGYNIRHTGTSSTWIAPGGDNVSYLTFNAGFTFSYADGGAPGRSITFTDLARLDSAGSFSTRGAIYPGYNDFVAGTNYSYYLFGNSANSGIRTNGNFLVNGDVYVGASGMAVWLTSWLNQSVKTDASPTFANVTTGGWFVNSASGVGLTNSFHGTHFSSSSAVQWDFATNGGSYIQVALRPTGHSSTPRGYLYADTGNNVGLLNHAGQWALRMNSVKSAIVYGGITDSNFHRFTNPQGGTSVTSASSATGAIKIRMPNPGTAPMMMATVKVYEYVTGRSFTITFGGHTSGGNWYNTTAYWGSDLENRDITVRFGTESGYYCVWIGETGSTWSYPQVWLTDVQIGYSAIAESWANDWAITFETALGSISQTKTLYGASTTGGANRMVQRDASGYIFNSYFNTSSGGAERNTSGLGYFAGFNSSDYYIRSYTPTAARAAMGLSTGDNVTFNTVTATTFTGTVTNISVNYSNNSAGSYQMIWGSGTALYGTAGIYCDPLNDIIYASAFNGYTFNQNLNTTNNVTFNTVVGTNGGSDSDITLKNIISRGFAGQARSEVALFTWKNPEYGVRPKYGYIAQEVQEWLPEAVFIPEGKSTLAVDYAMVHTVLIDDNTRRIRELENEVAQLKSQLNRN